MNLEFKISKNRKRQSVLYFFSLTLESLKDIAHSIKNISYQCIKYCFGLGRHSNQHCRDITNNRRYLLCGGPWVCETERLQLKNVY